MVQFLQEVNKVNIYQIKNSSLYIIVYLSTLCMCLLAITLLLSHLLIFLAEANNLMQSFKDLNFQLNRASGMHEIFQNNLSLAKLGVAISLWCAA